jgi:hypothetical protein
MAKVLSKKTKEAKLEETIDDHEVAEPTAQLPYVVPRSPEKRI